MTDHRFNGRTRLAFACASAVLGLLGCSDSPPSARDQLRNAAGATYPNEYGFEDTPDAAPLLECVGAQRGVVAQVDTQRSIATYGFADTSEPLLVWTTNGAYVRSSAVTHAGPTKWLSIDVNAPDAHLAAVTTALGPSLSAYLAAASLPLLPADMAASAAENADFVVSDGRRTITARVDDGVLPAASDDATDLDLGLEFELDAAGRVDRISVRGAGEQAPETIGFTLDYDWEPPGVAIAVPTGSEVTDVTAMDPSAFRSGALPTGCSLGS